ncbi:uncharacterized protein EAF01_008970 [Botrytis porri]|uniref:uncharacterized protein n=1 Tax=Botrytis porri TaxID=87229 RepID=UPI0019018464|nr:uncharacterized protein EAF01_008970 [Botrytis porri]KAF7898004.1 hypothetical protein EAF01_008970 [Botrytis porri]
MTTVKPIVEERQHHSWGLLVQGRPATPSEGRAQQYTRIGSKDTQSLITHNNGTCLEFGPWDLVDEFDASKPFYQQILLIDTTIRDIRSVRIRHNDTVGDDVDVFKGFRTIPYTGERHQHVYPNGETYEQVPSYYASVANTPSMYSTTNKSDVIGEAHPGLSSDTRFGVLVPSQDRNAGRGGNSHRGGSDRGRGNQHHGERGGYAQHLNRRGRRDQQFGRGQGQRRGDGSGDWRGTFRNVGRGGRHHDNGNHHVSMQDREPMNDHGNEQIWGNGRGESTFGYQQEAGPMYPLYNEIDRTYPTSSEDNRAHPTYAIYNQAENHYMGQNGDGFAHASMTSGPQGPVYPGYEAHYAVAPPNAFMMGPNRQASPYFVPVGNNGIPYAAPVFYPYTRNAADAYEYTNNPQILYSPEPIENNMGGHSQQFMSGQDIGIAVPMGPDHSRANPRPRVVLPPTTPGIQMHARHSAGSEEFLGANVQPPTPFGVTPGRSPMRTTTDEGSPLMRPRRHATEPTLSFTPLAHGRSTSGSGTDLRRLATGNSGFAIAEARSSTSAGAFSPESPNNNNNPNSTARSSPGLSFSALGVVGPMARTSSTNELKYVGYTIQGQSGLSSGSGSRTSTPIANPGRRWFEARQFVPSGSRLSSPGVASPGVTNRLWAESRSENGQI